MKIDTTRTRLEILQPYSHQKSTGKPHWQTTGNTLENTRVFSGVSVLF